MPGNVVEEFFLSVGLETNQIDKGLDTVQSKLKSGFMNIMKSAVAPALSMLGAFSAGDFIQQLGSEAQEIQRYAQLVGMSTEQMSAWAGAADRFGIEAGDLTDILTDVNDKVTDVVNNDAGPFKELIERGLIQSFQHADGTLKTTEEIIEELSDAVKGLGGQEGAGLLKRLGFNDPRMLSFMMQGGDAMRALVEQMKAQGGYTDADAESAKQFTVALKDMARSLKMLLLPVFRVMSPMLAALAKGFDFGAKHAAAFVPALIALSVVMAARLIPTIKTLGKEIKAAFSIKRFGIVAALIGLGLLLDDFVTWLQGGKSAFGDFYDALFGGIDGAKKFIEELMKFAEVAGIVAGIVAAMWALSAVLSAVQTAMSAFGIVSLGTFGLIIAGIGALIAAAWLIYNNWDEICAAVSKVWEGFINGITGLWNGFTGAVTAWLNWFANAFSNIINKIVSFGEKIGSFIGGLDFGNISASFDASGYATAASGDSGNYTNNVEAQQVINNNYAPGTSPAQIEAQGRANDTSYSNMLEGTSYNY